MNDTISVNCYGHYFEIKRIPTESTEMVYRRLWWMVAEWFRHPEKKMDELWLKSFQHVHPTELLYDFEEQDGAE